MITIKSEQIEGSDEVNSKAISCDNQNELSIRKVFNEAFKAPVQEVFPLVCPVMEYKWIPEWKCELIHFPNGQVELGTIFNEISSAPVLGDSIANKTTWTAVLYEPENHRVHFKLDTEISTTLYKMQFEPNDSGGTNCRFEMNFTPISEKGVKFANKGGLVRIRLMLSVLIFMLKHYCENGKLAKVSDLMKLSLRTKGISPKTRLRFLLNKLALKKMVDENREKFMNGLPIIVNSK